MAPGSRGTGNLSCANARKTVARSQPTHPQHRSLTESIVAIALLFCSLPFSTGAGSRSRYPAPAPIASHWFYCVQTETKKQKDTYFTSTFETSADTKDLLHDFSLFLSKEYDLPADHLAGSCYAVRRYKPDNFANVEEQRSQHMEQSQKQGQNVIATGWSPQ